MNNSKEVLERVVAENSNDYTRFRKELKKLLKEGVETDDIYLIGAVNYYIALLNFREGHRSTVLSSAYKAATMLDKTTEYNMIARSYNLLGIAYLAQENYQLALDAYNKALQTLREHRCKLRKSTVLNNVAECYSHMGEFGRSIRITTDCMKSVRKNSPEAYSEMTIYGLNLSEYYEAIGDAKKADEILDSVVDASEKIGRDTVLLAYYARRASVAYSIGDHEKAAKYVDLLLEAVEEGVDTYEIHSDFEKIAHAAIANGELEYAKRFADTLQGYAVSSGHTLDEIIAARVMAEYCMAVGDKEQALKLYSELNTLYMKRMREEKEMQFTVRKKVEETNRDIKKLLHKVRVSEENAERDPLTKLLNRSALVRVTSEFYVKARSSKKKVGGIFIDIDYFKEYNDTYGHAMGDEVIKKVAEACIAAESPTVRFARYGGDEFFGVVLGHRDAEVGRIAADICASIRESGLEHIKNPNGRKMTVSIGVVNVDMTDNSNTILDVVNFADKALYHAKAAGKNCIFAIDRDGLSDAAYTKINF